MSNDGFGDIFEELGRVKSQLEFTGESGETRIDEIRTNLVRLQADVVKSQAQSQQELSAQITRLNTEVDEFKSVIHEKVDSELGRISERHKRFELDTLSALVGTAWKIAGTALVLLAIGGGIYWALLNRYFAAIDENGRGITKNGALLGALAQSVKGIESDVDKLPVDTLAEFETSVKNIVEQNSTAELKKFEARVREIVGEITSEKLVGFETKVEGIVENKNKISEAILTASNEKSVGSINEKFADLRIRIANIDASAVSVAQFRQQLSNGKQIEPGKLLFKVSSDAISRYHKYHPEAFLMSVKTVDGMPKTSFGIEGRLTEFGEIEVFITSESMEAVLTAELFVDVQFGTPRAEMRSESDFVIQCALNRTNSIPTIVGTAANQKAAVMLPSVEAVSARERNSGLEV